MTDTPKLRLADNADTLPRCVGCGVKRARYTPSSAEESEGWDFYKHASNCVETGTRPVDVHGDGTVMVSYQHNKLKARFLIGILSAEAYGAKRDACRETWMQSLDGRNAAAVFVIGKPDIDKPELFGDELRLPCPDTYDALPQKTRLFCKWATEHAEFDYLFKCDDDTYVHVPRLLEFPPGPDYVGGRMAGRAHASGGAGYMLSPKAAGIIAEQMTDEHGVEDKLVFKHLKDAGIDVTYDRRFKAWEGALNEPSPDNDIITGHYCTPDVMQRLHAGFGGSGLVWRWRPDDPRKTAYSGWLKAGPLLLTVSPPGTIVPGGPRADLWNFAVHAGIDPADLPEGVPGTHILVDSGFAVDMTVAMMLATGLARELMARDDLPKWHGPDREKTLNQLQAWLDEHTSAPVA